MFYMVKKHYLSPAIHKNCSVEVVDAWYACKYVKYESMKYSV